MGIVETWQNKFRGLKNHIWNFFLYFGKENSHKQNLSICSKKLWRKSGLINTEANDSFSFEGRKD